MFSGLFSKCFFQMSFGFPRFACFDICMLRHSGILGCFLHGMLRTFWAEIVVGSVFCKKDQLSFGLAKDLSAVKCAVLVV